MARYGSVRSSISRYAASASAMPKVCVTRSDTCEPAAGQQVEDRLEVASLGPAHLAGREVHAPGLVGRLVAAGTVGPGEPER